MSRQSAPMFNWYRNLLLIGALRRAEMIKTRQHPLYWTWEGMRKRCNQKSAHDYPRYGGRGVTVCPEWKTFWKFLEDMGEKPSASHSLDRIDNSKGYSKDNCRWATKKQQQDNRRITNECYRGHPWTTESTYLLKSSSGSTRRRCKICLKQYTEDRKALPRGRK